ncbi:hypothetical protein [Novosphingobium sp.]|uniref:hypothetical protein n=1 Tax=Novosphingobium sp. TaxID=1874826 RepID=UPI002734A484|nr:hypothetical protein [Novosphingobium sp.]MDP3905651.1 hypothetical protein [Novosphingobium sp.]
MNQFVSLIIAAAALFLAVRALRGEGLSFESKARMAAAWVVIILVVAFVASRFAG